MHHTTGGSDGLHRRDTDCLVSLHRHPLRLNPQSDRRLLPFRFSGHSHVGVCWLQLSQLKRSDLARMSAIEMMFSTILSACCRDRRRSAPRSTASDRSATNLGALPTLTGSLIAGMGTHCTATPPPPPPRASFRHECRTATQVENPHRSGRQAADGGRSDQAVDARRAQAQDTGGVPSPGRTAAASVSKRA